MARHYDWVPVNEYNNVMAIGTGLVEELPLLDNASWSLPSEVVGDIEGEDVGYRIHRIVGQFSFWNETTPSSGNWYLRLWPGFQDQLLGTPLTPGLLAGANDDLAANEKMWWERVRSYADTPRNAWQVASTANHPWHYVCDVKPNYYCPENMVPVLTILNSTDANGAFLHRWRMLVSTTK